MLIIRKEQLEVLSASMVDKFIDSTAVHLRTIFPDQTDTMQDADLKKIIKAGILQAKQFDITIEEEVLRYLELMVTFGPDFINSPDYSWARQILEQDIVGTAKILLLNEYIDANMGDPL